MKNILALSLIAALSFSLMTKAEEMALPVIQKPAVLNEGTQTKLSDKQIAELEPWARDSKIFLNQLLEDIESFSATEKIEYLVEHIKEVVGESAPKNNELLMRFILNRALVINDIIVKESSADIVGTKDAQFRVLVSSAKMAIKYYDVDMETLSKHTRVSFSSFGHDYFIFLNDLDKSIFDATAQYTIERTALEWLAWDLYRDLDSPKFASLILRLSNGLKIFQDKKLSDTQAITSLRQMKKLSVDVEGVFSKINDEKQLIQRNLDQKNAEIELQNYYNEIRSRGLKDKAIFDTYMSKKSLASSIGEAMANAREGMKHVGTVDQFFEAISPGTNNPSGPYKDELRAFAVEQAGVLVIALPATVSDVRRLMKERDFYVKDVVWTTAQYLPKIHTAKDFLLLTEYLQNPSSSYRDAMKKFVTLNMDFFISLNPTIEEKNTLLARYL